MKEAPMRTLRVSLGVLVALAAIVVAGYSTWFYWEFGALPASAGSTPPRIRWCGGGETFAPTPQSVTASSVPIEAVWQASSLPAPYSWRAIPPKPPTTYSGIACPMELYLKTDAMHFVVYARSGGP
jgi:hypothetical protein